MQMIMGLPAGERDELLATVAQRMELAPTASDSKQGVTTPMELYDFQLTGKVSASVTCDAGAGLTPADSKTGTDTQGAPMMKKKEMKMEGGDKMLRKLGEKMEKYRRKISENEMDLARAERLLSVADLLIGQGKDAAV